MNVRRVAAVPRSAKVVGAAGTTLVHGALVAGALLAARGARRPEPMIYSVELVAAPRPTTTSRPSPPAAAPTPPAPPKVAPKPAAKSVPTTKPKTPPKVDPKAEPAKPSPAPAPAPGATPSTGTDADNVKVTGAIFPYPEYLRNLTNQILRRWARPAGSSALEVEVSFTIRRDGSVQDIKVVRTSRSFNFDLEAQGAVEQASEDRAFGPLPKGWTSDILQVAFLFTPRTRP